MVKEAWQDIPQQSQHRQEIASLYQLTQHPQTNRHELVSTASNKIRRERDEREIAIGGV